MTLDPQLAQILPLMAAAPRLEEGTPAQARASLRALTCDTVQPDQVIEVASVENITLERRPARVYRPVEQQTQAGGVPTLVYFHGGGFVIGDLDTHDQTCRRLCRDLGVVVVSIDYPLAPEHKFPAAPLHAVEATAHVQRHLDEFGGSETLVVAGDSAGGNLAAVVAQTLNTVVSAQFLIYPATDGATDYPSISDNAEGYFLTKPMIDWFAENYLPADASPEDPRLRPIIGEVSSAPAAVVVTCEYDPLRDEGEAYADRLREAGTDVDAVRYAGLIHGFIDMAPMSQGCADALEDMVGRCGRMLARVR